jgi:hypothetical protein
MADQTFTLRKPIMSHQGSISALQLNYPTARCYINYGMPYATVRQGSDPENQRVEFNFNPKVMFRFIADMSGIDELSLEDIDGRDVMPLFWFVVGMLNSAVPQTSST